MLINQSPEKKKKT